jgi:hypothetical protein
MRAGFVLILLLPFIAAGVAAIVYMMAEPFISLLDDIL